jgi:hypothetical protein
MPPGEAVNRIGFDSSLIGNYCSVRRYKAEFKCVDSLFLCIQRNTVFHWGNSTCLMCKIEFDSLLRDTSSHFVIKNNYMYEPQKDTLVKYPFFYRGDSVFIEVTKMKDSLWFSTDKGDILKGKGNRWFLNKAMSEGQWEVTMLEYSKNKAITLCELSDTADIKLLKNISGIKEVRSTISSDTCCTKSTAIIGYLLNPTKRQFRKFLRKGGFSVRTYYAPMINSIDQK